MSDAADSVIEKIKKAIRLAKRTTEAGERETAMRLAKSLAERNGLAFAEVEADSAADAAVKVDDPKGSPKTGCEVGFTCAIIHEHFGVVTMTNRWSNGKESISWFGSRLNIDIARHVRHILIRESRKAWGKVKDRYGEFGVGGRKYKESFMRGFFCEIYAKLAANPLRNDLDALAAEKRAADRKFEEFKAAHEAKIREKRKSPKTELNDTMLTLGMDAGRRVNLARPCEGAAEERLAIGM